MRRSSASTSPSSGRGSRRATATSACPSRPPSRCRTWSPRGWSTSRSGHAIPNPARAGGTLIIALILLAVLSVLGVAAVSLASRERQHAAGKARVDALLACAQAARAQVWAEVARYGPGYFRSPRALDAPIELSGYGQLAAPAHYDSTTAMHVDQVVAAIDKAASDGATAPLVDLTNGAPGGESLLGGPAYRMSARCTNSRGNSFEVEFSMRFALF